MNQTNKKIRFKRERELGEVLGDTFGFIRENYKSLLKTLFTYVGPAYLVLIFAMGFYVFTTAKSGQDFLSVLDTSAASSGNASGFFSSVLIGIIFLLFSAWVYNAMLFGTINLIIKSYINNDGKIDKTEVGNSLNKQWPQFLGLGFLVSIFIFFGLTLFIIPGIFIAVPLALVYSIKIFKNYSIGESISYSFSLVKNNWWISFLTLVVMMLLYYLINIIFQVPAIIYSFIKVFTLAKEGSMADTSFMFDWVYLSLSVLSSAAQYIVYIIVVISTVFIYFNLDEKKNATGTYEDISKIGE
ncbi:hypothetical protein [Haloflavibacter putidus]|uniref:Glycerophosphoryl diester phosphodiesterase membrane domain-containing protein n=1 Tax=Haloflavibacter putidus TaxID=2576776 RepID=A0A507ZR36_9FLAO|nr:hypothetical protein [Haloflavibacter putidus]TQD39437.1 hypothetical protein FKR84_05950 [Haloflavibacter putidus]